MNSRLSKLLLTAAVAAAAVPAAASAATVTYIDGGNVWVASPDGAIKRQLSSDAQAGHPYMLPTMSDDGDVTALRNISASSAVITVFGQGGARTDNVMPWKPGTFGPNFGPMGASVNPTGGQIAYTYGRNYGPYSNYPNGGVMNHLAVVERQAPGSPTSPSIDQEQEWHEPTWIDDRLLISKGGELHYEIEPLKFTHIASFNPNEDGTRIDIDRGMVSRSHDRYLLQVHDWDDVRGLYLGAHAGAFPGGSITDACWVPIGDRLDDHWGLSPDGRQVTWSDAGGVHVGTFSPEQKSGGVCAGTVVTLSPSGKEPSFGATTLPAPAQPAPPAPPAAPAGGSTTPKPAPKPVLGSSRRATDAPVSGSPALELSTPATATAASMGGGLRVNATAPKPGTLGAKLVARGRTLGTARMSVSKAGRYVLRLKLTKAGRKAIKRLKGKKAKLVVTFVPRGGGSRLTSSATVTLK